MNYHQNADRQRRYAIRKMRVCVGSVLVGFFLLTGNMATVQAAETSVVDSTMLAGNNSTADATPSTNDERRPAIENTSTESGETKDFLKEALPTSTENSNISTEESKSDSDAAEEKALPTSIEESSKVSDNKVSGDYNKTVTLTEGLEATEENIAKQEAKAKDMKRQAEARQEQKVRRKRHIESEQQTTEETVKPVTPRMVEKSDPKNKYQDVVKAETSAEAQKRTSELADIKVAKGVKETLWVQGVKVDDSEFVKHQNNDSEYFVTKHSTDQGWYDINKAYDTDGDLCAGVVAANMLHWWTDQNRDYIKKYLEVDETNGTFTISNKKFDFRHAQNMYSKDNKIIDQSYFFDIVKQAFQNRSVWTNKILDLYINGYGYSNDPFNKTVTDEPTSTVNFFKKVFGKNQLTNYERIMDYEQFSQRIKAAIEQGKAIGLGYYSNLNATGHMVTVWGADFDKDGKVVALYISDSDDTGETVPRDENSQIGLKRHDVKYHDGQLKLTSYHAKGAGAHISFINTLSQGKEYWDKYFKKTEVIEALKKAEDERKAKELEQVKKSKAEQDAKRKAEEKAAIEKAKAEQDAKRKAEEKAAIEKAKAEQDAKRKAEEKVAIEKSKAEQEAKRKAAETQNKEQEVARQVETNSQSEAQPQSPATSGMTTVQHQESAPQRSVVSQGQTEVQRAATTTRQAPTQSLTTEQTQNTPVAPKASEGEKANVEKKSEDKKATSKEQVASAQEVKKATEKKQHLILPLVLALSAIILGLFGYSKMQNKKED
ncbi:IdeS/Mac family cysteine endopeptidase [Streptococcus ruminantium]|uniref:IdeS/Mac family cysteine endopeptidase n=1 Tax=Streptococcus ruminantium TaxID=1917441 RepID=UPI00280E0183|nr:IdeS/Mac family cysteine endopeptidase [Streptococcus ruminantium]MDQ8760297.1 IdeS/Mac family cysteine endopeptidase [Streptococcus ruminantium]MDQ8808077.1 IdeS/Mac family cysteine endopeptidase [Streptococcus ruminantium]MDQ8843683.1 IdeS/Mac family cysteine endopeptidase [Streptococcus ruminantium]